MSLNFINAMSAGYGLDQILDFIGGAYPEVSRKLRQAKSMGQDTQSIMKFINGLNKSQLKHLESKARVAPEMENGFVNSHRQARQSSGFEQVKKAAPYAAGALALGAAAPMVGGAMRAAGGLPGMIQQGIGLAKGLVQNPVEQAKQSTSPEQISQAAPAMGQEQQMQSEESAEADPEQIIDQMQLGDTIRNIASRTSPQDTAMAVEAMLKPHQKQWLRKNTDRPFRDIVGDYLTRQKQKVLAGAPQEPVQEQISQSEQPQSRLASLPDGSIGEIVSQKNGIAKVMTEDGKERHTKANQLTHEPPDLENAFNTLMGAIPENERSAAISFAGYDPESETLILDFHTGDKYLYPGATKEQADRIINKVSTARTTGEHPVHAWTAGQKSRGAGTYEVLKELEKEFGKNFIRIQAKGSYDLYRVLRPWYTGKAQREKQRALSGKKDRQRKRADG